MAIIKKPRKNRKGPPPEIEEASNNLTNLPVKKTGLRKDLNFKVDPDFKKEFKNFATDHDLSMHDLLIKVFNYYKVHS
ncbi:MAG: hypothetical protein AB8G11_14770 [Saprospiraceae bacterium]